MILCTAFEGGYKLHEAALQKRHHALRPYARTSGLGAVPAQGNWKPEWKPMLQVQVETNGRIVTADRLVGVIT